MKWRVFAIFIIFSSLACNFVTRAIEGSPAIPVTLTDTVAPASLTPAYIPAACGMQPLATIPAATALAEPTPILQDNPEVSADLQLQVFEDVILTIEDVYVYPDFNGLDWEGIKSTYRAKIQAGLTTKDFYETMQAFIAELQDEHSYFESPVEVAMAEAQLAGNDEFVGIGAYTMHIEEKGRASIIFTYPNSPADHAGLKPHDSVLAVDGLPIVENGQMRAEIIRGPECSAVVLTVQSPGEAPRDVMLVRERIQGPMLIQSSLVPTTDGSRIGYIFLPTFFDETIPGQVRTALENFGPLDGLILDNRLNGGGSSSVVEPLLSYFSSGTLGNFVSHNSSTPLLIEADPIHNSQTVPLVILVSEDSVSFGEIFSGVLRDAGRAKIVGEPTLGNVEILHGYIFADGSYLWIAEETFVAANSSEGWEATGIIPDVVAYADWDTFTFENDPSVLAAVKLLGHE